MCFPTELRRVAQGRGEGLNADYRRRAVGQLESCRLRSMKDLKSGPLIMMSLTRPDPRERAESARRTGAASAAKTSRGILECPSKSDERASSACLRRSSEAQVLHESDRRRAACRGARHEGARRARMRPGNSTFARVVLGGLRGDRLRGAVPRRCVGATVDVRSTMRSSSLRAGDEIAHRRVGKCEDRSDKRKRSSSGWLLTQQARCTRSRRR